MKDIWADLQNRRAGIFWIVVALISALSGPYGSHAALDLAPRTLFWVVEAGFSTALAVAMARLLLGPVGPDRPRRILAAALIYGAVIVWPLGLYYRAALGVDLFHIDAIASHVALNGLFFPVVMFFCQPERFGAMPVSAQPGGAKVIELFADSSNPGPHIAGPQLPAPRILDRLEPDQRGALQSLQVRDHYVVVRTAVGETSLLMRLSDAITETAPETGAQVHRSWWVAWRAVAAVDRDKGRVSLRMVNGQIVPVSRANMAKVDWWAAKAGLNAAAE